MKYDLSFNYGPKVFGLELNNYDYDWLHLISGTDIFIKGKLYKNPENVPLLSDYSNEFVLRTDSFYNIAVCSSPIIVCLYDQVRGGESDILKNFISSNSRELSEIDIYSTYKTIIKDAQKSILEYYPYKYSGTAIQLGLLQCRYFTDHFFDARHLPIDWKARYYSAKAGKVELSEVKSWINEVNTPSIDKFFRSRSSQNTKLHDEFKKVLDQVLKE